MNTISKLLLATAVVASFAAPALATDYNSNNFPSQARDAATIAPVQTTSGDWAKAYAMDKSGWAGHAMAPARGGAEINGGM